MMDEEEQEYFLSKLSEEKQREIVEDLDRDMVEDLVIELEKQRRDYAFMDCRDPGNLRMVLERNLDNTPTDEGDNQSRI